LGAKSTKSVLLAVALREISFSGGALALAASLPGQSRERAARILATIAQYFVAIPVLFFNFEQFMHGNYVPGIPLNRVTPEWVYGHAIWTYLAAVIYAVLGMLVACCLLARKPPWQRRGWA
jgi:Na+-driven multidrug efflux pump